MIVEVTTITTTIDAESPTTGQLTTTTTTIITTSMPTTNPSPTTPSPTQSPSTDGDGNNCSHLIPNILLVPITFFIIFTK